MPSAIQAGFSPSFPRPSTSNWDRPQVSHSTTKIFYCDEYRDKRKCNYCRRESHAASDRARLVLRQFARGVNCRAVPKACKRCGQPGRCGLLRTVSHGGTATGGRDEDAPTLSSASAPPQLRAIVERRWKQRSPTLAGELGLGRRRDSRSECGSGGWPGPHFFLALSSQLSRQEEPRHRLPNPDEFFLRVTLCPLW